MKTILIFFATTCQFLFSQTINFNAKIKAIYDAELQLGTNYHHSQKFVLLTNGSNYYSAGEQNYLNDTKQYVAHGVDTRAIKDYLKERIYGDLGTNYVFETVGDSKIKYIEKTAFKWVLYPDTKMIAGVKCQMAATNKFGRRWIAYFSTEYPFSNGPYKFGGLPGLIFEISDTKGDYHFILSEVQKTGENFSFSLSGFKTYSKKDYLKASDNLRFTVGGLPVMESEQQHYMQGIFAKLKSMYNNPLEKNPFE